MKMQGIPNNKLSTKVSFRRKKESAISQTGGLDKVNLTLLFYCGICKCDDPKNLMKKALYSWIALSHVWLSEDFG